MLFRVNTSMNKFYVFGLALLFTVALAGCGGGGGTADTGTGPGTTPDLTPAEQCVEDGGRVEDDDSCTSAADVAAEKTAADTKSAGTKEEAITEEADQTDDAGIGGATATDLAIAHKDGAVSISVSRGMGDDKVDFVKMADLTGADGSTGSMNVLGPNDDGETEIAIVYTDIEAPKATDFEKVKNRAGVLTQELDVSTNTDNDVQSEDPTPEAIAVNENSTDVLALVKSAAFTAGTVATLTFDMDDTGTTDEDEAYETDGTYNGADGTYRCNGNADCTVMLDAKGAITAMSDGWIFTPGTDAKSPVPDYDYLHYGAWLKKTAQDDGSEEYNEVQTFADSSLDVATTRAINGSATYKGGAAGVYVRNVYEPSTTGEQELDYATSGHFTAAVDLTATFTGNSVAVDDHNSVKGTINGFTLSGGEDASGWGVNVDATISGAAFTGTAKGGGADDGSITGNFHGDDEGDTDNDAETPDVPIGPKVMVGEFNAEFTNGSVAGGFGARRQ